MLWKGLIPGLLLLISASCAVAREQSSAELDARAEHQVSPSRISTTLKMGDRWVSDEECQEIGGEIRRVCRSQGLMCVMSYADAGAPCKDSSDCEGQCRYEGEELEVGTTVVGECQDDDDPCGCWVEVIGGRTTGFTCAD